MGNPSSNSSSGLSTSLSISMTVNCSSSENWQKRVNEWFVIYCYVTSNSSTVMIASISILPMSIDKIAVHFIVYIVGGSSQIKDVFLNSSLENIFGRAEYQNNIVSLTNQRAV